MACIGTPHNDGHSLCRPTADGPSRPGALIPFDAPDAAGRSTCGECLTHHAELCEEAAFARQIMDDHWARLDATGAVLAGDGPTEPGGD